LLKNWGTFARDSNFESPGRSLLAYNSQFFSYLVIYPQDVSFSHTGQREDSAEFDFVLRSWCSSPGKEERSNQPSSFTREQKVWCYYFFEPPHTKSSSFCLVSHVSLHPWTGSSFSSLSPGSWHLLSSNPPLQSNS